VIKGTVVQIIEANEDRILFEEWTDGMPRNDAKLFRVTPAESDDAVQYPRLTIDELKPKEIKS
jgi:hypothetical protein